MEGENNVAPEGSGKGLSPEELERKERLVSFLQAFVKAMLQTGYYSSDHPQAQKAREGLYDSFRQLLGDSEEVSFLARFEKGKGKDIYIDGVTEEPTSLNKVMTSAQSELFLPKFSEYFHRRGLVSFSLKNDVGPEEFDKFVDIMSERRRAEFDDSVRKGQELTRQMVEDQIVHVSTVFDDDVVKIGRAVPWRVEMALLRLRKDLSVVPMFKHLDSGQMSDVKRKVIEDITRPITEPRLFVDLLLNAQYVVEDVPGLQDIDMEVEIIRSMNPHLLGRVTETIADKMPKPDSAEEEDEEHVALLKRLLKRLGSRMMEINAEGALQSLYKLHDIGILSYEELPEELRHRIEIERMTQGFLTGPHKYVRAIESPDTLSSYNKTLEEILGIFPELVRLEKLSEVKEIFRMLRHQSMEKFPLVEGMPTAAEKALNTLNSEDNRELLSGAIQNASRQTRMEALEILNILGESALPQLVQVLASSQDATVRKSICQNVSKLGRDALPYLHEIVGDPEQPWYLVRNLVGIIGEIGSPSSAEVISGLVSHPHPKVREEALVALQKLLGSGIEPALINALKDSDLQVVHRAVAMLGALRSSHSGALSFYLRALRPDSQFDDRTRAQVCMALGLLGKVRLTEDMTTVDVLAGILERKGGRSILGIGKKTSDSESSAVRVAAAKALAKMNTDEAIDILKEHEKDKDDEVANVVKDAVKLKS